MQRKQMRIKLTFSSVVGVLLMAVMVEPFWRLSGAKGELSMAERMRLVSEA